MLNITFTFIVAQRGQKLASLQRLKTVSACGRTEAEARTKLHGLPLVFIRRMPAGGEA